MLLSRPSLAGTPTLRARPRAPPEPLECRGTCAQGHPQIHTQRPGSHSQAWGVGTDVHKVRRWAPAILHVFLTACSPLLVFRGTCTRVHTYQDSRDRVRS